MNLSELKQNLLKNPEFKKEWERFDLWLEIQMWFVELLSRMNQVKRTKF